ncbi:hypothetical protein HZI31_22775 [Serratia fonticola]|uniref:hypothetical protein n=1 Tax=Serratia fonticola TaxID=47917 RepID=UPI0015C5FD78|nr:hypothetical protein [Serratia fonticola]NXZ90015.1 hypothetical protein [Serratia fonticola]NYA46110.1 hypothetical protein [Serratia fonticola]
MHTQNVKVNVNGATEASRICERTTPRFDGFVCNIHSRHPFDVIRADVVIQRLEKEANKGCGSYYEIYESRLLSMAMNWLEELPLNDRPALIGAAAKRGIMLTQAAEKRAQGECDDLMAELAADY